MTTRVILPGGGGSDASIVFSDITTGNVTSAKHGFAPKSPGDATKYLDGSPTPGWSTPGGGAMVLLADSTAPGNVASFDLTSLSGAYKHLLICAKLRSDVAAITDNCNIRVNNDSTSVYDEINTHVLNTTNTGEINGSPSSAFQSTRVCGGNATSSTFSNALIWIVDYTAVNRRGFLLYSGMIPNEGSAAAYTSYTGYGSYRGASAISRVTLTSGSGGNFVAGSRVTIFGMG